VTAPLGHAVAPGKWRKRCPECGREFIKGRSSKCCEPCRKKLKAWRKKTRREVRRAALGLFPFQRTTRLKLDRRKPTARTRNRYRKHECLDCGVEFLGGARALRCVPCNDAHRRRHQAARDNVRAKMRGTKWTKSGKDRPQRVRPD
jgi:hypothetical protein